MTTQTAISAQSFGTSTNVGDNKFSINPLTLADGTTAYVVNIQVTTTVPNANDLAKEVRVWYTTTPRTVSAANAPGCLGSTARYVDIRVGNPTVLVISKDSALEPKTGAYFHCWVSVPNLLTAATLDVVVVEIPS